MEKKYLNNMFENLLHIGNKTNFWNAKMRPYIYGSVNGIHVINLLETAKKLDEVKAELKELTASGKKVLFVWTKLQAKDAIAKIALDSGNYYVSDKWVPGLLTNFDTIRKRINTYLKLLKDSETGALDVLTKKEKAAKLLEIEKLDKAYSWVKEMKKIPDIVFVVDGVYERQAIKEANSLKLKTFAVLNTNGDDTIVDNCIPANTNSVKSIEFLLGELAPAISKVTKTESTNASRVKKVTEKKVERKPAVKKMKKDEENSFLLKDIENMVIETERKGGKVLVIKMSNNIEDRSICTADYVYDLRMIRKIILEYKAKGEEEWNF